MFSVQGFSNVNPRTWLSFTWADPCPFLNLCAFFNLLIIHVEPISLKNLKRRSEFFEQGKRAAPVLYVFFGAGHY